MVNNTEILLEGLDEKNITSILSRWQEVNNVLSEIQKIEESLRDKIKVYLKERKWEKYKDENTNISVTISTQKRETIDKGQLKLMLSESQYAQVLRTSTFEKVTILTPEARARLNKYAKGNK